MTIPDDVRAIIHLALIEYNRHTAMGVGVALAWLDAQPAAPEPEPVEDVRERIAAIQHEIWAHWMRYLFDVCETSDTGTGHMVIIPEDKVRRWQRQMNTAYVDLDETEKESDRHQADKVLDTLEPAAPEERWEPVEDGCHGNVRQRDGSLLLDMGIEDDERIILLPAGYALCRRPEVTP